MPGMWHTQQMRRYQLQWSNVRHLFDDMFGKFHAKKCNFFRFVYILIGHYFSFPYFDFFVPQGNCDKCCIKYTFNGDGGRKGGVEHEHIINDQLKRKAFCSEDCVYAYVRDDAELVVCCMCRHRMPYYASMRRSYDDRCFCSLDCIQAAEQNIEQLLQNDEQFHLDILNFKYKSRWEDDDDSDMESSDSNQGSEQYQICRKHLFYCMVIAYYLHFCFHLDRLLFGDSQSSIESSFADDALRPSSALIGKNITYVDLSMLASTID